MRRIFGSIVTITAAILMPLSASAKCDITSVPCWSNGKCNIDFRNKTGDAAGADKGTALNQSSAAQTIKVKAKKDNGNTAGNTLTITAGAKNTMNVENKYDKNFDYIRVSSTNGITDGVTLSCATVIKVLQGSGSCKIFHGENPDSTQFFHLGYSCDGGSVVGPLN